MNKIVNSLTVLRGVEKAPLFSRLFDYCERRNEESFNDLVAEIYRQGAEDCLLKCLQGIILHDVNAFSVACAEGKSLSPYLRQAYLEDVKTIFSNINSIQPLNKFKFGRPLDIFEGNQGDFLIYNLEAFYRQNGYGQFIDGKAFTCEDGKLIPLSSVTDVTLEQLKDYKAEKQAVENNVCDFLSGLPFSHMLLYGDRGTGKSSTVHALLNKYAGAGLRLIELEKEKLKQLKKVRQLVAGLPLKFVIFIDDLSLDGQDETTSLLKAAVEGSVVSGSNVMIVATSNRRHIVKESFSDRNDSLHPTDSIEEQLSLSDRFGLTVMFSSTDKPAYLSIVRQLAADRKLTTDAEKLGTLAERWAIIKGGRSPRRAKQFIDYAYACEQAGREIGF